MNKEEVSTAPLTEEELAHWNETHSGDWQQVHTRFVGEVIAEIEGAKITRNVVANEDARCFLTGFGRVSPLGERS